MNSVDRATTLDGRLGQLHTQYDKVLRRYVLRAGSQNDVDDIVQETYIRLLHRIRKSPDTEISLSYIFQTALSVLRDRYRRQRARGAALTEPMEHEFGTRRFAPDVQLDDSQRLLRLQAAIQALPPKIRDVFVLVKFERLRLDEAARELGVSKKTVQRRLARALESCHQKVYADIEEIGI